MKERYVPIRPGIEEHLVRSAIGLLEFGSYALIHIQADYRTGIWRGSAPRILATAPRGASLRQIQRVLEHLEELGYLKSFRVHGARGNTPYLIDKFTVRSGALKGYRVNAAKSESWQRPFYELVAEPVAEDDAVLVAEGDALSRSKKEEGRSKKENQAAKTAPPADPRFQPFFDFAYEAFRKKHNQPPTWGGKDKNNLKQFLREQPGVLLPNWQLRFTNYINSTEEFTKKQGCGLAYFATRFDTFKDGPILEKILTGGSNGKRNYDAKRSDENLRAGSRLRGDSAGLAPRGIAALPPRLT
ncbi:MAG TPA: hypothetical protein VOA41_11440 [Candidatus Dormibacteraeota bacterium]|nr:hypothetical protein [Candidatus Dormibacteraeota bacterium]